MVRRALSEPEKKIVAARQKWRCSVCSIVLPSTYQVDHTVPLCDGGPDTVDNCTAMCPNCHAQKTQKEAVQRSAATVAKATNTQTLYDNRTDFFNGGIATCELCGQKRPMGTPHERCVAIDRRGESPFQALERFKFVPRGRKSDAFRQFLWS